MELRQHNKQLLVDKQALQNEIATKSKFEEQVTSTPTPTAPVPYV